MVHEATALSPAHAAVSAPVEQLVLPTLVFGTIELNRLGRELEALEDFLDQSRLRQPGKQPVMPKTSRLLDALATENKLNLLIDAERATLAQFLKEVGTKAPTIHISFASDPSAAFTAKIVTWLRANLHPHILLQVGLQPNIAAGCVLRTANRAFDLSLRHRFDDQRQLLLDVLEGKQ